RGVPAPKPPACGTATPWRSHFFLGLNEHQTAEPQNASGHRPVAEEDRRTSRANLSRSLNAGYQRSVGLCNSTARCRCVGDSVEHDEIADRADVAGAGDARPGLPQLARVGLTFVTEYIVLGGDDESVGQPLELIGLCAERCSDDFFAGCLVRQI